MTSPHKHTVRITKWKLALECVLGFPAVPRGVVLFAHGSSSGRFSPRNNFVAHHLQQNDLATLLLDLLTPDEAND